LTVGSGSPIIYGWNIINPTTGQSWSAINPITGQNWIEYNNKSDMENLIWQVHLVI
jgi:hypothetical protein